MVLSGVRAGHETWAALSSGRAVESRVKPSLTSTSDTLLVGEVSQDFVHNAVAEVQLVGTQPLLQGRADVS